MYINSAVVLFCLHRIEKLFFLQYNDTFLFIETQYKRHGNNILNFFFFVH